MLKWSILAPCATALGLAAVACAPKPPPPTPPTRISQAEINDTCESSGISQQRDLYVRITDAHIDNLLQPSWRELSGRVVPDPNVLLSKLRRFRIEVDGAYKLAVAQCKTHLRCLDANNYNEAACLISGRDRTDAERRFTNLSRDFADIDRDVVQIIASASASAPPRRAAPAAKSAKIDCRATVNLLSLQCIKLGGK